MGSNTRAPKELQSCLNKIRGGCTHLSDSIGIALEKYYMKHEDKLECAKLNDAKKWGFNISCNIINLIISYGRLYHFFFLRRVQLQHHTLDTNCNNLDERAFKPKLSKYHFPYTDCNIHTVRVNLAQLSANMCRAFAICVKTKVGRLVEETRNLR